MMNLSSDNNTSALFSSKQLEEITIKEKLTQVQPHKFIYKEGFHITTWRHVFSNCLCDTVAASVKPSLTDYMIYNLEPELLSTFHKIIRFRIYKTK